MLQIKNIAYRIGERLLFENATLTVPNRHKVGLVGRNGSGKTTLFRLITGEIEPDSGSILFNQRLKIGTVAQEAPSDLKIVGKNSFQILPKSIVFVGENSFPKLRIPYNGEIWIYFHQHWFGRI